MRCLLIAWKCLKEARPVWRPWLARHVQKSETSIYWSYFEPDNNPDTYSTCQTKFAHGLMISFSGGACWYGYSVLAQEGPAASDNLFYPAPEPWKRSTYPPERSREPFMLCHQPDFTLHSYLSPSKIVQKFLKNFWTIFDGAEKCGQSEPSFMTTPILVLGMSGKAFGAVLRLWHSYTRK